MAVQPEEMGPSWPALRKKAKKKCYFCWKLYNSSSGGVGVEKVWEGETQCRRQTVAVRPEEIGLSWHGGGEEKVCILEV